MKYHNIFLGIDYGDTYRAVTVTDRDGTEVRFETGDPEADFALAYVCARSMARTVGCALMTSSSLDGFVFDVPGWRFNDDDMLVRDPRDHIATWAETCSGCPMQWEGTLEDGTFYYARYRDGRFRVGFGASDIQAAEQAVNGSNYAVRIGMPLDGTLPWAEALPHFNQALLRRVGYDVRQDD